MEWLNEPPIWNVQGNMLIVTAGPKTDFWRTTHYGFIRDNGHCYYQRVARRGPAIEVSYALEGATYTMLRLAYLTEQATILVGPMCAAPDGYGFQVTFDGFTVKQKG